MIQRWLLFWLVLLSGVAWCWPTVERAWPGWMPGPFDPFLDSAGILAWLIALAMFAVGTLLPHDELRQVARRWPAVLGGTAIQYTSMPLLAWVAAKLMGYEGDQLIGLVVVGCVPGAMASNVLTHNAGGNTSFSVSLTTLATLVSPLTVPLALWLILGRSDVRFHPLDTSRSLLLTVVLPVAAGYTVMRLVPTWRKVLQRCGPIVANVVILWIIAIVVAKNRDQLGSAALAVVPPLLAVNLAGYLVGNWGARAMRLPVDMQRALTLEIGMQNAGVGTFLVLTFFPDRPAAAVAPAVYTFGCMFTGTALAHWWAWRGRRQQLAAPETAPESVNNGGSR